MREVDDAYRQDEMQKFMSLYGRWIVLAVALLLAALGGFLFWQAEQKKAADALSERFTLALDKVDAADTTGASTEFDAIATEGNAAYRALAGLSKAGIAIGAGDLEAAAGALAAVGADGAVAQPLRDVATLQRIRAQFDSMEPAEVLKVTAPFLEGDSPWFPIAAEMAALAHLKAAEPDKAGPLFLRLAADRSAPESLRSRAEQMAASLGQDVTALDQAGSARTLSPEDAETSNMPTRVSNGAGPDQ